MIQVGFVYLTAESQWLGFFKNFKTDATVKIWFLQFN